MLRWAYADAEYLPPNKYGLPIGLNATTGVPCMSLPQTSTIAVAGALAVAAITLCLALCMYAKELLSSPTAKTFRGGDRVADIQPSVVSLYIDSADSGELEEILSNRQFGQLYIHDARVDDERLGSLLSHQHELEVLECGACSVGTSTVAAITRLPRLRVLSLYGLSRLSIEHIGELLGHHHLDTLYVSACDLIVEHELRSLVQGRRCRSVTVRFKGKDGWIIIR